MKHKKHQRKDIGRFTDFIDFGGGEMRSNGGGPEAFIVEFQN